MLFNTIIGSFYSNVAFYNLPVLIVLFAETMASIVVTCQRIMHILSVDIRGQNGVQNALPHCLLVCLGWVSYLIKSTISFCSLLCCGSDTCIITKDHLNDLHRLMNANICLPWILLNPSYNGLTLVLTFSQCNLL